MRIVEFFDGLVDKRDREKDIIVKRPALMIKFTQQVDGCVSSSERPATEQDQEDFKVAFAAFSSAKVIKEVPEVKKASVPGPKKKAA